MIDLSNHFEHKECGHYIYVTIGINERKGFLYVGQHKCYKKGEFDETYFGSGTILKSLKRKYGKDYIRNNFRTIPIWWCKDQGEANEMEVMFIKHYESMELGFNLCEGGGSTNGFKHSEEARKKMSESRKGTQYGEKNNFFGKHHSEEAKQKMSEAHKGKTTWMKGRHFSEEEKQKLSEAHKGKFCGKDNPNFKGNIQAYKDGVLVKTFENVKEIHQFLGKENKAVMESIYMVCNEKRKNAYGYMWKREIAL